MIKVNVINKSTNPLPKYETLGSSGMDLRANLSDDVVIMPLERKLIPTGIYIELPKGYEAQIRPRSGLAFKHGITVLNTPGTIDDDYRGQIQIILANLSDKQFTVKNGERIAQMVFAEVTKANLNNVLFFDTETERGAGGFGHTGV